VTMTTPSQLKPAHATDKVAASLIAALLGLIAALGTSVISSTPAYAYTFDGNAARGYAQWWYDDHNPKYRYLGGSGGDCTNFVSQAWFAGGVPMRFGDKAWYHFKNARGSWQMSKSFVRVKGFRSYWYDNGSAYKKVEGKRALSAKYSPAIMGDVYIYDSGNSRTKPVWIHANISIGYNTGYDMYSQHSPGRYATDWRNWARSLTSGQRRNFYRSGHGIRVIRP
jgi:hypothetical protein